MPPTAAGDDRTLANEIYRFLTSVGRANIDKNNLRSSQCNYDHSKPASVPRKHPAANQFSFMSVECSEVASVVWSMPPNGDLQNYWHVIEDSLPAVLPT